MINPDHTDDDDDTALDSSPPPPRNTGQALAQEVLALALNRKTRSLLARGSSVLIVRVPDIDWVDMIAEAFPKIAQGGRHQDGNRVRPCEQSRSPRRRRCLAESSARPQRGLYLSGSRHHPGQGGDGLCRRQRRHCTAFTHAPAEGHPASLPTKRPRGDRRDGPSARVGDFERHSSRIGRTGLRRKPCPRVDQAQPPAARILSATPDRCRQSHTRVGASVTIEVWRSLALDQIRAVREEQLAVAPH